MSRIPVSGTRWSLDNFQLSDGVLFAYGWVVVDGRPAADVRLELGYDDGASESIDGEAGLDRPDVTEQFGNAPRNCGFLFFASVPDRPLRSAVLKLDGEGGESLALTPHPLLAGNLLGSPDRSSGRVLGALLLKTVEHIRKGKYKELWSKASRLLPSLRAERADHSAILGMLGQCSPRAALIVDHRLGGGANLFRDRLIADINASGETAVLLSFEPPSLRYHLQFFQPGHGEVANVCVDQDVWLVLAASRRLKTVHFNNCVSFPSPERVPERLVHLVRVGGARLIFYVHDHYSICPSHFLLDWQGRYCGLPGADACRTCLPRIRDGLVSLFRSRDIDAWRQSWLACYSVADEIVCFAESGRALLLSCYPELAGDRVVVRPHPIESSFARVWKLPETDSPLKIGVVGVLNEHKGSAIVVALAREIARRGINVSIEVIGTLAVPEKPATIEVTGPYRREELPAIVRRLGIHMALMPSIWPETFSFVTHELLAIGVPVMTFDMGAQADAVRQSGLGRVVPMLEPAPLLDEIIDFAEALRTRPSPASGPF